MKRLAINKLAKKIETNKVTLNIYFFSSVVTTENHICKICLHAY